MSAKIIAFSAVVATASAFAPTAGFVPRLRSGATSVNMAMDKSAKAPVITIFDHRGCSRAPKEYTGAKAGGKDDEMMVKAQSVKIEVSTGTAEGVLATSLAKMTK
uniref:Phycoerythrin alpha-2 chain, chloroplastic n=2 Tax=Rhodomonas sp. (strain CS 24) TaxID=79257 RepID=PHE2_RHDS2|nr:RecName: Full=Phycoerythrin alpha-2 chain, chloroplastic; Flags: Precursor [Rhodomonas sp. CS24]CAD20039.1 phycoerythrin alpha-subunit 2 [Rhodomonas sp. CS24]